VPEIRSAANDPASYLDAPGFEIRPEDFARQKPDDALLLWEENRAVARCGLWWNNVASHPSDILGVVGHYFAETPAAGAAILDAACERLRSQGCTFAVGPMDGNTWQRYRFVTERGSEPPFFLEPDNPDEWKDHWSAAGFAPLAHYHSSVTTDLGTRDPRVRDLDDRGIRLRNIDLARFDEEFGRLHELSLLSFASNLLYTPISADDFAKQYAPVRSFLRPELAILAEQGGELIGFLMAVPDLLQAKRGEPIDTMIVKTMAVHPDHAGVGLGSLLMDRAHLAGHTLGFRRAIHALFHADNRSGKISRRTSNIIRMYTLFSRPLGGDA
jgi:GNAT superfamily N-acetyltransferase